MMESRMLMRWFSKLPLGYRLFLGTGIPMGLVSGFVFIAVLGQVGGLSDWPFLVHLLVGSLAGLTSGLGFGGLMAIALGGMQVIGSSKAGTGQTDLKVKQKRTFVVVGDKAHAFRQVKAAFEKLGVETFDILDVQAGVLTGHTKWSWQSYGENLAAVLHQEQGTCTVTITSEPRLVTVLVDYGKNRENIDAIQQHLLTELELKVEDLVQAPAQVEASDAEGRVSARSRKQDLS